MDNAQRILDTLKITPAQRKIIEAVISLNEEDFKREIVLFTEWKDKNYIRNENGYYIAVTNSSPYNIEGLWTLYKNL